MTLINTAASLSINWLNTAWNITPDLYTTFGSAAVVEAPEDLDILINDDKIFSYLLERFPQNIELTQTGGFTGLTIKIPPPVPNALPIDMTMRIPVESMTNDWVNSRSNSHDGVNSINRDDAITVMQTLKREKDLRRLEALASPTNTTKKGALEKVLSTPNPITISRKDLTPKTP